MSDVWWSWKAPLLLFPASSWFPQGLVHVLQLKGSWKLQKKIFIKDHYSRSEAHLLIYSVELKGHILNILIFLLLATEVKTFNWFEDERLISCFEAQCHQRGGQTNILHLIPLILTIIVVKMQISIAWLTIISQYMLEDCKCRYHMSN